MRISITSASIDVVSQASPTRVHDTRHQVAASASHVFDTTTVHAGYTFSTENDYASHLVNASVEQAFDDKNTTLALGYALASNEIGRAGDRSYEQHLHVHDGTLSWTQVINPKAVAQLTYQLGFADGFQASPYRFVPVVDDAGMTSFWVAETDPTARWRHALVAAGNVLVRRGSALQGDYRLYHDTWGITSHTVGVRWLTSLTPTVQLRLRNRFYAQSGASFYQARYRDVARYMTIDRELSALWSETFGAKLTVDLSDRLAAELKVDAFYYRYDDFPLLRSRLGANVGLGVALRY
jgi:hypothetical protein